MGISVLQTILWAAGFIFHAALLFILVKRSRWRCFPVFTSLIAYQLVQSLTLYLVFHYGSVSQYRSTYWLLALCDFLFQVALVFEMARTVFRPNGTWIDYSRSRFLVWSTSGTALAILLCLAVLPAGLPTGDRWEMRTGLVTSMLTCELFLCMLTVANNFSLLWRSHVMALGQGLAAWACCALIGDVFYVASGSRRFLDLADHVRMYVYLSTLVFWMFSFWNPERGRVPSPTQIRDYLLALDRHLGYDHIER